MRISTRKATDGEAGATEALRMNRILKCVAVGCYLCSEVVSLATKSMPFPTGSPLKQTTHNGMQIRIRKTIEPDIPYAASYLADSKASDRTREAPSWSFRTKLEALQTKHDLEKLLRSRYLAIDETRSAWEKAMNIIDTQLDEDVDMEQDELFLKVLWLSDNSRVKTLISKAARESRENNLWREHNFAITPRQRSWLNHLQVTAVDDNSGEVVGFCEIAMLSVPNQTDSAEFAPTVTNLAVAPQFRRLGIATRLLRASKLYVVRQWNAKSLALYVEVKNLGALKLYQNTGFRAVTELSDATTSAKMQYMVAPF